MERVADTDHQTLAPDQVTVKNAFLKTGRSFRYLLFKWHIIALCMIAGGVLGILYAINRTTSYTAQTTFVLDDNGKSGGGMGQYSSLAAMVGMDVNSGEGLFQGDNILELYKSRLMIEKALLSTAVFRKKSMLLIERFIEINHFKKAWSTKPDLKDIRFDIPKTQFTVSHDSIISHIVDDINKNYLSVTKPDKKLSIISVKVKASDPLFAKAFTENIVATVNSFYIQTKTKGITNNVRLLQHQADSVRAALNASIGGTAAALDVNPNPNPALQILRVPSQRRQVDVQASSAIYGEVIKNLEIAKSSLQRETPLIQVIDQPVLPLPNDRVGKLKALLTGMMAGLIISCMVVLSARIYQKIMG